MPGVRVPVSQPSWVLHAPVGTPTARSFSTGRSSRHLSSLSTSARLLCRKATTQSNSPGVRKGRGQVSVTCALDPHLIAQASTVASHLPLAVQDDELIGGARVVKQAADLFEASGIGSGGPATYALLAFIAYYVTAPPGILRGFVDYYLLVPSARNNNPNKVRKRNLKLGELLGEGAYGKVYRATLTDPKSQKEKRVVVKQAVEFAAEEVWMNERMRQAAPSACAEFYDAFRDSSGEGDDADNLWLVWRDEGGVTLAGLLQKKNWCGAAEKLLFKDRLTSLRRGSLGLSEADRKRLVMKTVAYQLLKNVAALHETGIVHRDVKPENLILSEKENRLKLIDLGAACDLRTGINYIPKEYVMDKRYAAPEEFVMPTSTSAAPPAPIAAALSPLLWNFRRPDRFDCFSVGLVVLQMAFAKLRNDDDLEDFRKVLEEEGWSMRKWRARVEAEGGAYAEAMRDGFELLDEDGGAGWELVMNLMMFKQADRLSASQALGHRWVTSTTMGLEEARSMGIDMAGAVFEDVEESDPEPKQSFMEKFFTFEDKGKSMSGKKEKVLLRGTKIKMDVRRTQTGKVVRRTMPPLKPVKGAKAKATVNRKD